jgi:hypothetical protein
MKQSAFAPCIVQDERNEYICSCPLKGRIMLGSCVSHEWVGFVPFEPKA